MTTTTAMQPSMSKALALLATGHTIHRVAELTEWPLGSIRALINGQKGWLVGTDDRVRCPGNRKGDIDIPDGVDAEHVDWARRLLRPSPAATFQEPAPPARVDPLSVVEIPIGKIRAHPRNVREQVGDVSELAGSIRVYGLLQPLTVRPHPSVDGEFETIAGHRRHAACVEAGLPMVPCVVRRDVDDAAVLEMMIIENVNRRSLNPAEKAEAFGRLRDDHGYTSTRIAARTGLTQPTVSYYLALLDLDDKTFAKVRAGTMSARDAVDLVRKRRAKEREKSGAGRDWTWEPDHFTKGHALAKKARAMCEARAHTARRRLGGLACGQCWETAIRSDERVVIAAESASEEAL